MPEQFYAKAVEIFFSLGSALVAPIPLAFCYRLTHRRLGYDRSFVQSLILMSVTVCAIMMGIRTNLALSLGLVGALSIVRFRTAIKSGTDLIFLLIAISMGLISSTGDFILLICSTTFLLLIILFMYFFQFGTPAVSRYTLIFTCKDKPEICDRILGLLTKRFRQVKLCSKIPTTSDLCEMTLTATADPQRLFANLEDLKKEQTVSNLQIHSAQEIIEL